MPLLSRWYIKAAMIYLVAGLLVGALQALQQPWHLPALLAAAGPAYVHLLVVGWLLALAGVAQALAGLGFAINTWPRVKVK